MNQVATTNGNGLDPAIIASLVTTGDLGGMNDKQKVAYYNYRCNQVGLDPSAKPFDLLKLNGKLVLYANAGCTQQLCAIHKLSVAITSREKIDDIYCVTARVSGPDGRSSENMGSVPVAGAKGEALSNLLLKATTKAIRRTVLAHVGLGMLSEDEVETIPNAQPQGRGNPLRQEFAALSYELDACKSQEQIDLLFGSPEFEDFERRDAQQSSGMSFAGMMRDKAEQMKKKLPERVEDKRNFVKTIDEYPDAGTSRAVVTPAGGATQPEESASGKGSNSPPQESAHAEEALDPEYEALLDKMYELIDAARTEAELKRDAKPPIVANKPLVKEHHYSALAKAYNDKLASIKEAIAATP